MDGYERSLRTGRVYAEGADMIVKCIDATLQHDILTEGREYEVTKVNERDGYYELSGLGRFSMGRFEPVVTEAPISKV